MTAKVERSMPKDEALHEPDATRRREASAHREGDGDGSAGRVPDFFIVGHEKCGTSALDMMLKKHPQVFLPDVKEQRFFAPELRGGTGRSRELDPYRPHRFDRYLEVFADAKPEQRIGDASPQYLRSADAARRIGSVQPDARIIAILREPVSFLQSFHLQWVQNNVETQTDFRKAMGLEETRRQGRHIPRRCRVPQQLFYSEHVRYVEQLRRYRTVFGAQQMLVLIYDDFRRDNVAAVRQVLRFLDVDDSLPIETVETRPLQAVRSFPLKRLADAARIARQNPAASSRFGRAVNALTPSSFHDEAFRARWRKLVYQPPAVPDERFTIELRHRFKGEVEALSSYLDRDLVSEWGYDRLD
jgi:hypothetical protein